MTSHITSGAALGFSAHVIEVESDSSAGLPSFSIVGLGGKAVMEARERVRSAITNSGFTFPARRITINLAPADLPKSGTHFDLPIALSILTVSGQLRPLDTALTVFAGELALDGSLRPVKGAIHLSELTRASGMERLILPQQNAAQAQMSGGVEVIGLGSLQEVFRYLKGEQFLASPATIPASVALSTQSPLIDDVYGQEHAKRALAIAAAGHHNILFAGPPGSGKTLLARVLRNLLPPLSNDEKIATTKLYSLVGEHYDEIMTTRPFRTPHHTVSRTALIGGGANLSPGEVSLAHLGVLFLDELPEYPRSSLEALRQPLEDRTITITRSSGSVQFPANFMLVATKNPCPCGYYGDPVHTCTCSPGAIAGYTSRLSGPLLDRIDLIVHVARVPHEQLLATPKHTTRTRHTELQAAISQARITQLERYAAARTNADLSSAEIKFYIPLPDDARNLLLAAAKKLDLSARSYFKIIKVARSIADLDASEEVSVAHISEALQYRMSDTP